MAFKVRLRAFEVFKFCVGFLWAIWLCLRLLERLFTDMLSSALRLSGPCFEGYYKFFICCLRFRLFRGLFSIVCGKIHSCVDLTLLDGILKLFEFCFV